ncbi:DUF4376 domain-containing protein [Salibacterium aidingense]|uniref:DUF4376 domain-containing protein n=1 Tax=Salibacterium aidingense TaxID=384933 RepID=UPI003BC3A593
MIIKSDNTYETNKIFPSNDWYNEGNYVIDETKEENRNLIQKIKNSAPYMDLVIENGQVIDVTPLEKPIDLDRIKNSKIDNLSLKCREVIINNFVASNGNGYRLEIEDQLNMQGQKATLDDDTSITEVDWMTIDDNNVTHSRDEWLTIYKEAFQHKNECIFKNKELRDQVRACETKEEVEAVTW